MYCSVVVLVVNYYSTYLGLCPRRKENYFMKKGIHPEYNQTVIVCSACGTEINVGSTVENLRVDTCSNCHPFYTGKQRFANAAGRIDKFNKKYGIKE